MTKPKKYEYRIQYIDNNYQLVDWTKAEFEQVGRAMENQDFAIMLEDGIFRLHDVRAIVFIPPLPEPTEEELKLQEAMEENELTEWGFTDPQTLEWLRANNIDVTKRVRAKRGVI